MRREGGQALVGFAIQALVLMMLTAGVVDAGLAFFQYNAISELARYGARWGAVVGGTCAGALGPSSSDFCDQFGAQASSFWQQTGNQPLQGNGKSCPALTNSDGSINSSASVDYYSVYTYLDSKATTVAAAIAQHFDSSSTSSGFLSGLQGVAFYNSSQLQQLKVCVALSTTNTIPRPGDTVSVTLYYPFKPLTTLLSSATIWLSATSQYEVE